MTAQQIVEALARYGIETTEAEVKAQLGNLSNYDEGDIPIIAQEWQSTQAKSKSGKLSKSKSDIARPDTGSIAKLDQNNLPQISSLTDSDVTTYIGQLEQMDAAGETLHDATIDFLLQLYDRRKRAIEFARSAASSFQAQDREMEAAAEDLRQTLGQSVESYQRFNNLMGEIAGEGSRFSDTFRQRTEQQQAAFDRFSASVK